jgi:hypothetical protein
MLAATRSKFAVYSALLLILPLVGLNLTCSAPLRVDPLLDATLAPVVDDDLPIARRYAPWLYHAVDAGGARQDIPAPVDFDGDLRGDNNWENFVRFSLVPTVYYSVLRTTSHLFISYHVFHPRDWEPIRLGLHLTHENDGENLAVVVDRGTGDVVLLLAQAHYDGVAHAVPGAGFADGSECLGEPPLLLDEAGRPTQQGQHAAVFVQARGHGLYSVTHDCSEVRFDDSGAASFDDAGFVLRPALPGEECGEPDPTTTEPVPYRLESTNARLWPLLADGSLVGEGRLLDGGAPFSNRMITIDVPRYYEADRFSGPFGPDRGIAPFAVDFGFDVGEVGALFFDPAARYAECLTVPPGWSLEYEDYPFTR